MGCTPIYSISAPPKKPPAAKPNPEFDASLHPRLYVDQDSSRLIPAKTFAETAAIWKDWRTAMNQAIRERKPKVTPASGDIRLHAKDARIHAQVMRYEPEPHKNVLGYWTKVDDWADWEFDVPQAGRYEVEVQQGCGTGCGGSNGTSAVLDAPACQKAMTQHDCNADAYRKVLEGTPTPPPTY